MRILRPLPRHSHRLVTSLAMASADPLQPSAFTTRHDVIHRALEAFRLSQDRSGRAAYISWLEARAENEGGKIDAKAMEAICGVW